MLKRSSRFPVLAAPVLAALVAHCAHADERSVARDRGALDFASENDVYGQWGDRYYTNGLRLAYVSPDMLAPEAKDDRPSLRWFAGAAQEIYTPRNRYTTNPPADDHPYSAWLYATGGVAWADKSSLDLFTLNTGVVGPSALGEQVQNNYHRAIFVKPLNGWDTQMHDEPGVNVAYLRVWRLRGEEDPTELGVEVLPRCGFDAGTVRTRAVVGVQVRFGVNMPDDFGEMRMRDGITGAAPTRYVRRDSWRWMPDAWYCFLDAQGEAWAHNMALDGSLWHDSRSVDSRPVVGQFSIGFAAHWGQARVAFTQIVRTEEFSGQKDNPFTYGALTVTTSL
jgi:lipid A 3-O-deacylase